LVPYVFYCINFNLPAPTDSARNAEPGNLVNRLNRRFSPQVDDSTRQINSFAVAVFALALAGTAIPAQAQIYTDLHDFSASAGDPHTFQESNLAQGRDGNFYAESAGGGTSGNGTVFKITPTGTPTIILSFDGTDGSNEIGGVTLGTDGNLQYKGLFGQ
jgi:hypothetical protein